MPTIRIALVATLALATACGGEPSDPGPDDAFPATLSGLSLGSGQQFEPQYPLWTNGSVKTRMAHVPAGEAVDISARGVWQYPEGMVFTKTFGYRTPTGGTRKIETRVIRRRDFQWETAVYLWDAAQTGAALVEGDVQTPVSVTDLQGNTFDHVVPSYSDCQACHGLAPVFILGFNELQLNAPRAGVAGVQLDNLAAVGTFNQPVPSTPAQISGDATTAAVIGYVQGNCVHCHHSGGIFDLTYQNFLAKTVNVSGPFGGTLIVPGDPQSSELFVRFSSGSMPPLGVQLRDETTRILIRDWITSHNFTP